MLRNYIFLIAICLLLGCNFSSEPKMVNSADIKVWAIGESKPINFIEEQDLILDVQSYWSSTVEVNLSDDIKLDYFIDGIIEDRLQYSSAGYLRVLSMNITPVYKLHDNVSFSSLVIPDIK